MDSNKEDNKNIEVVQDYNIKILEDIELYLQYIRDTLKQIIVDDGLKYSEPMDKKKVYPDFTYTQFLYLLSRVFDRVYSVNTELLCDVYKDKHNKLYNMHKVELCYDVYYKLCQYYGYVASLEGFNAFSGIDEVTLREWLSCGRTPLFNKIIKNAKNTVVSRFENSRVPILQLAAANYKYSINTEHQTDRDSGQVLEALPDLLALPDADE